LTDPLLKARMNDLLSKPDLRNVAHQHRGDLYREGEELTDTVARIRAHLREVLPEMETKARLHRGSGFNSLTVSIVRYGNANLSNREEADPARRLVDAELDRFTRFDWEPHHGMRNVSLSRNSCIDPAAHASVVDGAPALEPLLSFAEFTRTARPGDVLEHVSGEQPHQGPRVTITAISSRRLTTRATDDSDARPSRHSIQGGTCFVSDGELVCFKHSGFASQGGYSLMRWIRQG
jgi:hypothetical protein